MTGTKSSARYRSTFSQGASASPARARSASVSSMPRYSAVFSSGAKSAHFAPASIPIFAMVMREERLIASTVSPVNSSAR